MTVENKQINKKLRRRARAKIEIELYIHCMYKYKQCNYKQCGQCIFFINK